MIPVVLLYSSIDESDTYSIVDYIDRALWILQDEQFYCSCEAKSLVHVDWNR